MAETHWERLPESERARIHAQTGGAGVPRVVRSGLEALTGQDLSNVRVHYGSHLPTQMGARAFATGNDLFLAPAHDTDRVVAHELAHVVQQRAGVTAGINTTAPAGEAERTGVRADQTQR